MNITKIGGGWLTINRACNNRCAWCYAKGTEFKEELMNVGLAERLTSILEDLGAQNVVLIGGEPTLHPQLPEIISLVKKTSVRPALVSNGIRFADERFADKIRAVGLENVTFSMKAANREQYRQLTGNDAFHKVLQGFLNLKHRGLTPAFSVTIVADLLRVMPELLGNLEEAGVTRVSVDLASPVIENDGVSAEGIPNPRELVEACLEAYDYLKRSRLEYSFYLTVPLCMFPKVVKEELIKGGHVTTSCHVQHGSGIVFSPDGSVLPCNHFTSHRLGKYGVDFTTAEEFLRFWNSGQLQNFRTECSRYPSERCFDCDDWGRCGGGCLVKWLYWEPNQFVPQK